jgi:predicted nucleic-acid-binding Zn-ribbon protein
MTDKASGSTPPSGEDPGACVCLRCGYRELHRPGVACRTERCPECGATTVREGSEQYRAYLKGRLHLRR